MDDKLHHALIQALNDQNDLPWRSFNASEWGAFVKLAQSEGVSGLIHTASRTGGWGAEMPEGVRNDLAKAYYRTAASNQILFHELDRILLALGEANVPVIVLKGAALAPTLYDDIAHRPMNDLDLLVQPDDLFTSVRALRDIDYQQQKITYHVVMAGGADHHTNLELHWCSLPTKSGATSADAWFWEQTRPFKPRELPYHPHAYSLSPTANLLYLAAHLSLAHGTDTPRMIWCYDIDLLVREKGPVIDWDLLVERTAVYGWGWALYASLAAAQERFATPIPAGVPEALSNRQPGDFSSQEDQEMDVQTQFARAYTRHALRSLGWWGRLRVVLGMLFPSKNYMKQKYQPQPGWLWPINYLYRWVHL